MDAEINVRLAAFAAAGTAQTAVQALLPLHAEVSLRVAALKRQLLGSAQQWTESEKADAAWISAVQHDFAEAACKLAISLAAADGTRDDDAMLAAACGLYYKGEALKCDTDMAHENSREYAPLHALMRVAMSRGRQRDSSPFHIGGASACTIEALYFRALLLAHFAGGTLSACQTEILDAWICMWLPLLHAALTPQPGALRVDLHSARGLRRGADGAGGASLYVPLGPLEDAHGSVVRELQQGRILPAGHLVSTFRVEEHVAVLDHVARGLRQLRREPTIRAARHAGGGTIVMNVGLAEIAARGFPPAAPTAVARRARLVNESDTGFAVEADKAECGDISVGDLVGLALTPGLVIGHVVRRTAARDPARVSLGIRRLAATARPVLVREAEGPASGASLVFVPGTDASGMHDGFLMEDAAFCNGRRIEVEADGHDFSLRFNRVRESGQGWVLAGFEVLDAGPSSAP